MVAQWGVAAGILAGAALFLYLYHLRPRGNDVADRRRVMSLPVYAVVDKYLKVSTLGIALAAIFFDHPLLLEVHDNPWALLVGVAIAGVGLTLLAVAMRHLDRQYTPCYAAHLPKQIVTTGPYRYVRHPIYTANILQLSGLLIASGSIWLGLNLALMVGFYVPIVLREERTIHEEFPEYGHYVARTGRFFPRCTSPAHAD